MREIERQEIWEDLEKPGYLGGSKDKYIEDLNTRFGKDNWRFAWELKDGKTLEYIDMFALFIKSYALYFKNNPVIAKDVVKNFAYICDKDFILKEEAFNPYYLYLKPGYDNQFHHVAINLSLVLLGYSFKGNHAGQAREGKILDYLSPGRIECCYPELIPDFVANNYSENVARNSIENLYQATKVVQIRS